jgi:ABC-type transport system substrate-binding protein
MIGNKFFTKGITVYTNGKFSLDNYQDTWYAYVDFEDFGYGDDKSIYGKIGVKYYNHLDFVIDTMIEDCRELGIQIVGDKPLIVYEDIEKYPPPDNILEILQEQAERIGFQVDINSIIKSDVIPYG